MHFSNFFDADVLVEADPVDRDNDVLPEAIVVDTNVIGRGDEMLGIWRFLKHKNSDIAVQGIEMLVPVAMADTPVEDNATPSDRSS